VNPERCVWEPLVGSWMISNYLIFVFSLLVREAEVGREGWQSAYVGPLLKSCVTAPSRMATLPPVHHEGWFMIITILLS